ncbi:MAG: glycoside hydrolase family 38 C-terminal domain-containing protein [Nocardioidaceae bacterium]
MHRNLYDPVLRMERTLRRVQAATYVDPHPVQVEVQHLDGEPEPFLEVVGRPFEVCAVGDPWGAPWSTSWFHLTGEVPAPLRGRTLELHVDLGFTSAHPGFQAEGLAYDATGRVLKGVEPRTAYVPVAPDAVGVDVYVEAAANPTVLVADFPQTSLGDVLTAPRDPLYRLAQADLVAVEAEVQALGHDLEVLLGTVTSMLEGDPRRARVLTALLDVADQLDVNDLVGTASAARDRLSDVLASPANASAHRVSAAGHAHIDSAWLWPVRETKRKCARTFANVVALAEEHPDLRFACSSAQQYAWVAEQQPELFDRIKAAVAAGTFVPVGGMWVESDTNLPSGEAMVRQLVHGTRFFREELGVETPEVWLPDSFGYAGSLPQIFRLAGKRWFLSQKMSWNQTDDFPHHSFWWEGIDGTRVFTHFPPTDTYNAEVTAAELAHGMSGFRDAGPASRSMLLFGYGDGGGGPTREMVERAHRFADLEGMPRVVQESPAEFFAGAEEEYVDAPVWAGEMYLEYHRGVYTAQIAMKQGNRRTEHLLREAELWATLATLRTGAAYPYDELERLWRETLLHQFHDILPGSSIAWVHREARETYAALAASLESVIGTALAALSSDGSPLAFNASPFVVDGVPALGAGPVAPVAAATRVRHGEAGTFLENEHLRVEVDAQGLVVSVHDVAAGREVLAAPANLLQLHPDTPNRFDAWDVEAFATRRVTSLHDADSVDVHVTEGGVAEVHVVRRSGPSSFEQWVRLAPGSRRVDFETTVDWQHDETMLKVAFPLALHADRSTSEIGYGHVHRPTHANTGWDAAQFEICAHRWIHVGEPGYGAALVNVGTYGHDVSRSTSGDRRRPSPTTVRLTLARSPRFPDPDTDRGRHTFRYGLVAGADVAAAVQEGYAFALPPRVVTGGAVEPVVHVVSGPAVVEAVKLAEDRSGDVVVRLYEAYGGRGEVLLDAGFDVAEAGVTDLHEKDDDEAADLAPLQVVGRRLTFPLGPFQIVTLRLTPGPADSLGTQ